MFKISARYNNTDWKPLGLDNRLSPNWEQAIKIIEDRFYSRYLSPVSELICNDKQSIRTQCGFIVMGVDCSVIETMAQFYCGAESSSKQWPGNGYVQKAFSYYFAHTEHANFSDFRSNPDYIVKLVSHIRNGLLHQAETKSESKINIKDKTKTVKPIYDTDATTLRGIEINRNMFHEAVLFEFNSYLEKLKNPESQNTDGDFLREKANKKMESICNC